MNFEAAMQGAEDIKKGPWYEEEDELLTTFVVLLGDRRWDSIAKASGLRRSGKSCRLRWKNYLRPNLKRSKITADEESVILQLHAQLGNKWSRIAQSLPGRTDNEIKNYWRTHLKKKALSADQERGTRNIMDNASPDCCTQSINTNGKECNSSEHIKIIEDVIETSWDNAVESSEFTSSPHETQLSDWISELSNDQSLEPLRDCNCVESSLCSLDWITGENCDTNLWDFSFSLWDMV